jgi:hypothetical protein
LADCGCIENAGNDLGGVMRKGFVVLAIVLCLFTVSLVQSEVAIGATPPAENQQDKQPAAEQTMDWKVDQKTLEVILVFFVLAVVFEMALAPIFNSSLFMARFEGMGIKTVITIVLALLVFWKYELDIFQKLLLSMDIPAPATFWGKIMTALLIAGGSSGFNTILANLGVRMKTKDRDERAAKLKADLEKAAELKAEQERKKREQADLNADG